jgi:hypothetical protein
MLSAFRSPLSALRSPLALIALLTCVTQSQGQWTTINVYITPDFAGATYYKRTVTSGYGGSTYQYSALTANPKAGQMFIAVWDITSNPSCPPNYRQGGTMKFTRIKDAAGNTITPTTPPGPNEHTNTVNVTSVSQPILNLGEQKVYQTEFVPQAGTYRLEFSSVASSVSYHHERVGTTDYRYHLLARTYLPPFEITVDP